MPGKKAEEILWKKICVDLIVYSFCNKRGKERNVQSKRRYYDRPFTGWVKITQYDYKRAISITNLIYTTWLARYPTPMKITFDQE